MLLHKLLQACSDLGASDIVERPVGEWRPVRPEEVQSGLAVRARALHVLLGRKVALGHVLQCQLRRRLLVRAQHTLPDRVDAQLGLGKALLRDLAGVLGLTLRMSPRLSRRRRGPTRYCTTQTCARRQRQPNPGSSLSHSMWSVFPAGALVPATLSFVSLIARFLR